MKQPPARPSCSSCPSWFISELSAAPCHSERSRMGRVISCNSSSPLKKGGLIRVSNDWENGLKSFQRLENCPKNLPTTGKNHEKSSNDWKLTSFFFQRLEVVRIGDFANDQRRGMICVFSPPASRSRSAILARSQSRYSSINSTRRRGVIPH